jgi:hypothetical protein
MTDIQYDELKKLFKKTKSEEVKQRLEKAKSLKSMIFRSKERVKNQTFILGNCKNEIMKKKWTGIVTASILELNALKKEFIEL